jgi:hypothetical protein
MMIVLKEIGFVMIFIFKLLIINNLSITSMHVYSEHVSK